MVVEEAVRGVDHSHPAAIGPAAAGVLAQIDEQPAAIGRRRGFLTSRGPASPRRCGFHRVRFALSCRRSAEASAADASSPLRRTWRRWREKRAAQGSSTYGSRHHAEHDRHHAYIKAGVKRDGTSTGRPANVILDTGSTAAHGPACWESPP